MKKLLIVWAVVFSVATISLAETRVWTLNNGKTIEAEFMSLMGGKIALKNRKGKLLKIPKNDMSKDDMKYIELLRPPKLDFSFSKMTTQHVYPPLTQWFEENNIPPRSLYYTFSTQIKQTSANPYNHNLTAEIFVMAAELYGDKNILIDRREESFRLTDENKRIVDIPGAESLMLTTYVAPGGMWTGEKYAGYLIVVTDSRGEIIGHAATREWWYDKLENLREVPLGKTFDEEGNRCWPTRPKESSY